MHLASAVLPEDEQRAALTGALSCPHTHQKTAHLDSGIGMPKQNPAIDQLLNLGPTSTRWLRAIGVHTRRDLEKLGAVDAYAMLKANGYQASLNLVYAIEGALTGRDWKRLPAKRKAQLKAAAADAMKPRCAWPANDPLMLRYHDEEWGVPVHDDRLLFELLILEGAQAGLSWSTILNKRDAYRRAFARFDAKKVAAFGRNDIRRLMADAGIVRNRLKIEAAIDNAKAFLGVRKEFGSFDVYIWRFVGGKTLQNRRGSMKDVPGRTPEADAMSKDLKARGFRFVGPTICYAFMQAVGMVNDHLVGCYRYKQLAPARTGRTARRRA
jgi:DNA-3-methyladenine glycosylase I